MRAAVAALVPPGEHMMPDYPKQIDGLNVGAIEDGFNVYDPRKDRVHHLNNIAMTILTLCTGYNSIASIAGFLQGRFNLPDAPTNDVVDILWQFHNEGLVKFVRNDP